MPHVYKVVCNDHGILRPMAYHYCRDITFTYQPNTLLYPPFGKFFVFRRYHEALDFRRMENTRFDTEIWRCETSSTQTIHVILNPPSMDIPSLQLFWSNPYAYTTGTFFLRRVCVVCPNIILQERV